MKSTLRKVTGNKVPDTKAPPTGTTEAPIVDVEATVVPTEVPAGAAPVETPAAGSGDGFADALLDGSTAEEETPFKALDLEIGNKVLDQTVAVRKAKANYTGESGGAVEGDFDQNDLRMPRLVVVNGSGKMSEQYTQGDVVLADELLFPVPREGRYGKLTVVPIHLKKQWRQNLTKEEQEAGLMPAVVDTKEAAEELGGAMAWVGNEKPRWQPSGRILMLIQRPGGVEEHPAFNLQLDGKDYAPAVYYASGGSYASTVIPIFNALQWSLRDAEKNQIISLKEWVMDFGKMKAGNFTVYRPQLKVTTVRTSQELRDAANSLAGTGNIDEEA